MSWAVTSHSAARAPGLPEQQRQIASRGGLSVERLPRVIYGMGGSGWCNEMLKPSVGRQRRLVGGQRRTVDSESGAQVSRVLMGRHTAVQDPGSRFMQRQNSR
jgi:hypothetical protein